MQVDNDIYLSSCEFYAEDGARDHLLHYGPSSGLYDIGYLQALFNNDQDEISMIEAEAKEYGFDPSASQCGVVMNHTSVRVMCRELVNQITLNHYQAKYFVTLPARDHIGPDGNPVLSPMITIPCRSRFLIYQPLEEHRQACPKILVVCTGAHSHPVPFPTKTPSPIRSKIFQLLYDMDYDLPDMTPRRFLRHPTVTQFLATQFPNITNPSLSDLHISLANRDHLCSYIENAKASAFPFGTSWKGRKSKI